MIFHDTILSNSPLDTHLGQRRPSPTVPVSGICAIQASLHCLCCLSGKLAAQDKDVLLLDKTLMQPLVKILCESISAAEPLLQPAVQKVMQALLRTASGVHPCTDTREQS